MRRITGWRQGFRCFQNPGHQEAVAGVAQPGHSQEATPASRKMAAGRKTAALEYNGRLTAEIPIKTIQRGG